VREGGGREGGREGGGSEEGGGSKKGGGSEEGGGSDGRGRELWVVLGPGRGLWVVVVVGVHCCSWWWALSVSSSFSFIVRGHSTCLGRSFPSVTWLPTGRGGVMLWVLTANHQWAVDGGGAVLVGWVVIDVVGLLTYPL